LAVSDEGQPARSRNRLARLMPPPELPRVLVAQTFTYAVGSGFNASGSVIFFIVYAGLSAPQVAWMASAVGVVSLVCRLPCGMLADRLGGKRTWLIGAVIQGVMLATYPLLHGYGQILTVALLAGLGATLGNAGRGRYLGEAVSPGHRVRANAYLRSVLNVGMALGTVGAGFLVAVESRTAMATVVLANAATFAVDACLLAFFIKAIVPGHGWRKDRPRTRSALQDGPFLVLSLVSGVYMMTDTVLAVAVPLWVLGHTDAPRPIISVVLLINMIMVTLLQVWASTNSEDVSGAARKQLHAGVLLALACLVLPISAWSTHVVTWIVIAAAVIFLTLGEMFASASAWGLSYALSPQDRRGEYLAMFGWSGSFAEIVGPAGTAALALSFIPFGWIAIGTVFLLAGLATRPVAIWVERSHAAADGERSRADSQRSLVGSELR
jgi:MFS family permease